MAILKANDLTATEYLAIPVPDFQQWPPWCPLVVATATELARFTGQHLIAGALPAL